MKDSGPLRKVASGRRFRVAYLRPLKSIHNGYRRAFCQTPVPSVGVVEHVRESFEQGHGVGPEFKVLLRFCVAGYIN